MKFCTHCGAKIDDDAVICMNCGCKVDLPRTLPEIVNPATPMAWYKFLVYFLLFAGAVLNGIIGVMYITGYYYDIFSDSSADIIYTVFPQLKFIDSVYGIFAILVAVIAVVARFRLAEYKKDGPSFLYAYYGISPLISVIYVTASSAAVKLNLFTGQIVFQIAVNIFVLILNILYFNKRKSMFIN